MEHSDAILQPGAPTITPFGPNIEPHPTSHVNAYENSVKGLYLSAKTLLDNGSWVILRFLVDTGAVTNVLRESAVPKTMQRPLDHPIPLVGANGATLGGGTHDTTLKLHIEVAQPEKNRCL